MAFLTCSSPSPVRSRLIGVPELSGVAVGVIVGLGVGVSSDGVGVGVAVGVGVGVGNGLGVADIRTISFRGDGGRISVHTIAAIASSSTTATLTIRTVVSEESFFRAIGSNGEPHSGHRNSFVTTLICSFR
jgi:hypothetical protein